MSKIYGFFHPYCHAGGGGERVLWQAVRDTLIEDNEGKIIIYTGDVNVSKSEILGNALDKFDIKIDETRVGLVYLKLRWLVDSKTWPVLTLLGQAIGSMILTIEAIHKLKPNIWIDTMGYPFSYPVVWLFLNVPIITYTHFPIISIDMLNKLKFSLSIFGLKQFLKYLYWSIFMLIYKIIGYSVDIGICNSTWTYNHIKSIWSKNENIGIIYPPCSTEKLIKESNELDLKREDNIVALAQFRPEKRHDLIINEYSKYLRQNPKIQLNLILIGSIRNEQDEKYVESLKKLANDLNIPSDKIEFKLNLKFNKVVEILNASKFGLNAMWNEHFGIAVVEYIANGLVPIVHASAGPLLDIVVPWDSKLKQETTENNKFTRTGFFFKSETDPDFKLNEKFESLSDELLKASELNEEERLRMVDNGKQLVLSKFSDESFDKSWFRVVKHVNLIEKRILTVRNIFGCLLFMCLPKPLYIVVILIIIFV